MALRCLLFSGSEDEIRPISQVLGEMGVEAEFCANARDAVEKVATGTYQIVIADWAEQAPAAAILKTAREQRAANRPLALALVNEDSRLPEALRAGANSVLVRPLRVEAVRDTLKTACELLQAKQAQAAAVKPAGGKPPARALGASAGAGAGQSYVGVPVTSFMPTAAAKAEDKKLRAGEFLQSSPPAPSAQFETESDLQISMKRASGAEVDALKELEPMASAVRSVGAQSSPVQSSATPEANSGALTGWASLQARLNKVPPPPPAEPAKDGALLAYGETPSFGAAAAPAKAREQNAHEFSGEAPAGEADDSTETSLPAEPIVQKGRGRMWLLGAVATILATLLAVPRTRLILLNVTGNGAKAGQNWLNPKPAPLPQAVPLHDSFGQSGDEYKLPAAENIPDATTDPSQIRIVPVTDPTAKGAKNTGATDAGESAGKATAENEATGSGTSAAQNSPDASSPSSPAEVQPVQPPAVNSQGATHAAPAMQPRGNSPAGSAIPSSLQSQTASSTPEASGTKPEEAAMSSIEPVVLPETTAWTLLAQPVEAEYPAKAAGQRGSVLLQVLIARDGTVQDAKFVQGSLVFARAAIDAVKQWKFKPYLMNGRAVQVQSTITLNFKPPA